MQSPRERLEAQEAGIVSSGRVGLILELHKRKRRGRDGKKREWKQCVTTGSVEEVPGRRCRDPGWTSFIRELHGGQKQTSSKTSPAILTGQELSGHSTGSCINTAAAHKG